MITYCDGGLYILDVRFFHEDLAGFVAEVSYLGLLDALAPFEQLDLLV